MRGRVKVRDLMRKQDLTGEGVSLFPARNTGIIHGDEGYDVTFNDESLAVGIAYAGLCVGQRVSYSIFFAARAKVPVAINVQTAPTDQAEAGENLAASFSTKVVGSGIE
ncbi:MAG: hypothetical protein HY237_01170 [Acidobacteria bacterium]|nr:hypothetical protein [Acidobacteriota bacterium]